MILLFLSDLPHKIQLIQNIIFEKGGFFPVTISSDERKSYLDVISDSVASYKHAVSRASQDPNYIELRRTLDNPSLSLREIAYCKELVLKTLGRNTTHEERKFYDYIAEKVKDTYIRELSRMGDKK